MERRVWRAKQQGGYTRVFEYVDGKQLANPISVNGKHFGAQIAKALNDAYDQGMADAAEDGRKVGRDSVADMLDSRFDRDGYGEWQDGWRAAAKEARQHPV